MHRNLSTRCRQNLTHTDCSLFQRYRTRNLCEANVVPKFQRGGQNIFFNENHTCQLPHSAFADLLDNSNAWICAGCYKYKTGTKKEKKKEEGSVPSLCIISMMTLLTRLQRQKNDANDQSNHSQTTLRCQRNNIGAWPILPV